MKTFFLLLCSVLLLSGCFLSTTKTKTTIIYADDGKTPVSQTIDSTPESPLGESDYSKHVDGIKVHDHEETTRIVAQSSAISQVKCPDNEVAAAWCESGKMHAIADLEPKPYTEGPPVTMGDVGKELVQQTPAGLGLVMISNVAKAGYKATKASFGDGAQVSQSFNPVQPTAISNSGSVNATSSGTATPAIIEPTVITVPQ